MRLFAHHLVITGTIGTLLGLTPVVSWAASADAGKAIFTAKCKTCHGEDGAGNPAIAKVMKVELKALGGEETQKKSDAELKAVVTAGSGKMKPVAGVAGADLDNLVAAIRALKK